MKKNILSIFLLIPIVFLISGCGPKKITIEPIIDSSVVREVVPFEKNTTTEPAVVAITNSGEIDKPMACGSDRNCFLNQFLKCQPAEFKIISGAGEFKISIVGLAGERCYYLGGFYQDGVLVHSGLNCSVPKNLISSDTFDHFLGQDKTPDKENIKIEQDRIERDYCNPV